MKLIMDGEGNIYRSIAEAEAETGIPHQNISSVISGKRYSAGGTTWVRVDTGKDSPLPQTGGASKELPLTSTGGTTEESPMTYEDMVNLLIEKTQAKKAKGTPKQKAAAEKARAARKAYKDVTDKARSVGLLFYHLPKSAGKHPSNKKIHEYNLEANPDYKNYYSTITGESGKITDVDFGRLDW